MSGLIAGRLRGAELLAALQAVPFLERDGWIDDALGIESPPDDEPLPRGAVPYVPCGVDAIIATVLDAPVGPDDVLVDLGSGLGRVVLLAHLLTGARTRGIEIQEQLVLRARERCEALGVSGVSFVHGNALDCDLDGNVFFLHAPFNGETLARVVARLEEAARVRPIVVCTVGVELHVPWLTARASSCLALTIYDSAHDSAR